MTQHLRHLSYSRVSTEEQRDRASIETQRAAHERNFELLGVPCARWYVDDGVTGTIPLEARPDGAALLRDVRSGDVIHVWKLDRLGRGARHILNAVHALRERGADIRSITEPFDTSTTAGRFMLTILAGAAEMERDMIVERTIEACYHRAEMGEHLGGRTAYGYQVEQDGRSRRLVPHEPDAEIVRDVFRLCVEEGRPTDWIAEYLNSRGVTPPAPAGTMATRWSAANRGRWYAPTVWRILRNPLYKGEHLYGRTGRRTVRRQVPALVDAELWQRAQERLEQNRKDTNRNAVRDYLLRGLIRCGECGRVYAGHGGKKDHCYYICLSKLVRTPGASSRCPGVNLSLSLEDEVWGDIERFLRNPGKVLEQFQPPDDHAAADATYDKEVRELDRALAGKPVERDRILSLYRRGLVTDADLERQLAQIRVEEDLLQQRRMALDSREQSAELVRRRLRQSEGVLLALRAKLDAGLSFATRREIVRLLVAGIAAETVERDGRRLAQVTIRYRFDFPETVENLHGRLQPGTGLQSTVEIVRVRIGGRGGRWREG